MITQNCKIPPLLLLDLSPKPVVPPPPMLIKKQENRKFLTISPKSAIFPLGLPIRRVTHESFHLSECHDTASPSGGIHADPLVHVVRAPRARAPVGKQMIRDDADDGVLYRALCFSLTLPPPPFYRFLNGQDDECFFYKRRRAV